MKKVVSFDNLLPREVIAAGINELSDIAKIKESLTSRSIISADRFNLKPGVYTFVGVRAATWEIGKGKNQKTAVMCLVTFKNAEGVECETTIGSLRKIDSNRKGYGPTADMPVNEADLLDMLIERGIKINDIVETTATMYADGVVDKDEDGKPKTKPTKLMAWQFGDAKAAKAAKKA
jgi:hypothetical protein